MVSKGVAHGALLFDGKDGRDHLQSDLCETTLENSIHPNNSVVGVP